MIRILEELPDAARSPSSSSSPPAGGLLRRRGSAGSDRSVGGGSGLGGWGGGVESGGNCDEYLELQLRDMVGVYLAVGQGGEGGGGSPLCCLCVAWACLCFGKGGD